jgi:hypothetical protein
LTQAAEMTLGRLHEDLQHLREELGGQRPLRPCPPAPRRRPTRGGEESPTERAILVACQA